MTIWYPDVSNHEGAMALEAGTVAVIAKATEGTGYVDPFFEHFKSEAARVGAMFGGYHFLHAGNGAGQARFCFQHVGPGVPVMIDLEPTTGSMPTVQDGLDFAAEFRALGGICSLVYLPHWYWQQLGSPSLLPLALADLGLVSSGYTAYSDSGPGWTPYGGVTPAVWQYTDALAYSGQSVDFNAYRGTIDQFKTLLGYNAPHPAPIPAPPAPPTPEGEAMVILSIPNSPGRWLFSGGVIRPLSDGEDEPGLNAAGIKTALVSKAFVNSLLVAAKLPVVA